MCAPELNPWPLNDVFIISRVQHCPFIPFSLPLFELIVLQIKQNKTKKTTFRRSIKRHLNYQKYWCEIKLSSVHFFQVIKQEAQANHLKVTGAANMI